VKNDYGAEWGGRAIEKKNMPVATTLARASNDGPVRSKRDVIRYIKDEINISYGCETWSLTLREEHRLRVFENRVLRGIF
jgi:hypothetical protein